MSVNTSPGSDIVECQMITHATHITSTRLAQEGVSARVVIRWLYENLVLIEIVRDTRHDAAIVKVFHQLVWNFI